MELRRSADTDTDGDTEEEMAMDISKETERLQHVIICVVCVSLN